MTTTPAATLRSIALPVEHGGWGFTLEPLILGLLVAPSRAGIGIAVAAIALFLARRPWRLVAEDHRRGRRLERTAAARRVLAAYAALALAAVGFAGAAAEAAFWWPLAAALPLGAIQVTYDSLRRHRELLPEIAGALAMAAAAPAIAAAAGWSAAEAAGLWVVMATRNVPSILVVRALVRRVHHQPAAPLAAYVAHPVAVAAVALAAPALSIPGGVVVPVIALLAVAVVLLARPGIAVRTIGWAQIGIGLGFVIAVGLIYRLV